MPSARHEIADRASKAWEKYESTVRTGGTPQQRRFACDVAVRADEKLAAFDRAQQSRTQRERQARALSGA